MWNIGISFIHSFIHTTHTYRTLTRSHCQLRSLQQVSKIFNTSLHFSQTSIIYISQLSKKKFHNNPCNSLTVIMICKISSHVWTIITAITQIKIVCVIVINTCVIATQFVIFKSVSYCFHSHTKRNSLDTRVVFI